MKNHRYLGLIAAVLAILPTTTIAGTDATEPRKNPTPAPPITAPQDAEFFQLTFPRATKPQQTARVLYNSIVDHTPPFYGNSNNHDLVPYTGEYAYSTAYYDPNVCADTSNGREFCYNGHSGLDIRDSSGTPVYAAHAGIVLVAGPYDCYGTAVLLEDVDNPQYLTLYGHLTSTAPNLPSRVARGQLIGYSGNTACPGGSTGPHLHFGLYYNQRSDSAGHVLDPYGWFSQLPNSLGAPVTDYKWASGYAADGNQSEPENWNLGALTSNTYVAKNLSHRGSYKVGASPSPTVDPIEHWWANNYGSAGAPYNSVNNATHGGCQDFEGGTYCRDGSYFYHFEDVTLPNWANRYIGWAQNEGIIVGYPCGTRGGEPCVPPNNRPYFEPTRSVTRGEYSKVVYVTLSLTQNLSGAPHFCDVPPGDTFYVYIETLYNMGAFTGYPGPSCGYSSTYFYPGNTLTRGQASKILANTATTKGWLSGYGSGGGPDFWDVSSSNTFYNTIEKLYNAGVVQYRVEEAGRAGQGGHYFVDWNPTRAEIAMYLHELVYAVSP